MPSIKNLTVDNYGSEYSADFLQGMNALTNLTIIGNGITDEVEPDLGPVLRAQSLDCLNGLTTLEEVDFSNNYISDISVLRNLPNLKRVKMSGNSIVNAELLPDGVEVVG